jgi:hypothetical protein
LWLLASDPEAAVRCLFSLADLVLRQQDSRRAQQGHSPLTDPFLPDLSFGLFATVRSLLALAMLLPSRLLCVFSDDLAFLSRLLLLLALLLETALPRQILSRLFLATYASTLIISHPSSPASPASPALSLPGPFPNSSLFKMLCPFFPF